MSVKITLPNSLKKLIAIIEKEGYEAYAVGGAVRDALMGKTPYDYDVTTSCPPEELLKIFEKTIPTGIKHGTVTVIVDGDSYEVTKYRIDGEYLDHRKPDCVEFCENLEEDLSRRDFTINAIAYSDKKGIIDLFCGKKDIEEKIIRCVGDPEKRFSEDALRILRAIRFSSQLGFSIEANTKNAIIKKAKDLKHLSAERIANEVLKILASATPENLEILIENGGFSRLNITSNKDLSLIKNVPNILPLRLALFCILCSVSPKEFCKNLKLSNALSSSATAFYEIITKDTFSTSFAKSKADIIGYDLAKYSAVGFSILNNCDMQKEYEILENSANNNEPYKISMLALSGKDLLNLGFIGEEIGKIQNILLQVVLENPKLNNKKALINIIKTESFD